MYFTEVCVKRPTVKRRERIMFIWDILIPMSDFESIVDFKEESCNPGALSCVCLNPFLVTVSGVHLEMN